MVKVISEEPTIIGDLVSEASTIDGKLIYDYCLYIKAFMANLIIKANAILLL